MRKLFLKVFIWLGKRLFKGFTIWGDKENPDCINFTMIQHWERKHRKSKKFFGVKTPSARDKKCAAMLKAGTKLNYAK